jgi:hypothetical protein
MNPQRTHRAVRGAGARPSIEETIYLLRSP